MAKICFILLLIVVGNNLTAQYIHYSDKRNINNATPAETTSPKIIQEPQPKVTRDTVTVVVKDTIKVVVKDTLKITVHDTLKVMVRDTVEIVIHDTVNICPVETVYHKWPDRCPGLSGSIPVLSNYIAPEMVSKLTEIYKGHLYSISSARNNNKVQYKLKVCENGVIRFEYADENGTIISKGNALKN